MGRAMAGGQDDERGRRLAAALRENLKRRKAQERGRDAKPGGPGPRPEEAGDSEPPVAGAPLSTKRDAT